MTLAEGVGVWAIPVRGKGVPPQGGDMGYSMTWTAVRGKPADAVLAALGLARTGRTNDDGITSRDPFAWCQLDDGWVLVLADAGAAGDRFMDDAGNGDAFLAALSAGCEVVACFAEEHVMVSRAAAWKDGMRLWDVKHDAQVALDHLVRVGEPPAGAEDREEQARLELANDPDPCDFFFDVPVGFANAVVGYRYDEGDHEYEELDRVTGEGPRRDLSAATAPARRSFLSRVDSQPLRVLSFVRRCFRALTSRM